LGFLLKLFQEEMEQRWLTSKSGAEKSLIFEINYSEHKKQAIIHKPRTLLSWQLFQVPPSVSDPVIAQSAGCYPFPFSPASTLQNLLCLVGYTSTWNKRYISPILSEVQPHNKVQTSEHKQESSGGC
jgi:hypothetical protein